MKSLQTLVLLGSAMGHVQEEVWVFNTVYYTFRTSVVLGVESLQINTACSSPYDVPKPTQSYPAFDNKK